MHTPALYSVFLRALVAAKTEPPSNNDGQHALINDASTSPNDDQSMQSAHNNSHHNGPSRIDPLSEFQFDSEMGPVADISTFPPTMAPTNHPEDQLGMLTMDSILSSNFWDSVLVPGTSRLISHNSLILLPAWLIGYSYTMEGISGGFVYGAGGSRLITPRMGISPLPSGLTPLPPPSSGQGWNHQELHDQLDSNSHSRPVMSPIQSTARRALS